MRLIRRFFYLLCLIAAGGALALFGLIQNLSKDLPDYQQLAAYDPPIVTRLYAGDGRILAELAAEKRVFVPIPEIPERVIHAFLSAEDKNFYTHRGIDITSVLRALIVNIKNYSTGHRPVGASTITQQVAKNFLLSSEVSYTRKIKEALLSLRIEKAFTKERILELYLNEIFLGQRAYGVAAAAVSYFNKSLDELTIAEAAYLAALPKAPNNYHPVRDKDAAYARRNWVLKEMEDNDYITAEEKATAEAELITLRPRPPEEKFEANYFAEEVRRELLKIYGDERLYKAGLAVRTTIDPRLQESATRALQQGLMAYDRRHGWRGAVVHLDNLKDWDKELQKTPMPLGGEIWRLAVVLDTPATAADIGFADGTRGSIPLGELTWARPWQKGEYLGPEIKKVGDVLKLGDVILVESVTQNATKKKYPENTYALRQIPAVQGGLVAMDPHTGRVLAMSGGFSQSAVSDFNRATQALRQPGSSFKPFVYLAALDKGFTPSSLVLDAPVVVDQGVGLPLWRPSNYTEDFLGPTTLRVGIEKSRNLMTVRLAQNISMETVSEYAQRFGITDNLPPTLAMALGAGETTVLKMTGAYGMLANGGKRIIPSFIDRIQDQKGRTVYRHDQRPCIDCAVDAWRPGLGAPDIPDTREQVGDPKTVYQMVSIMQGVVQRGTGAIIASLNKPLAGKTGTTNDSRDAWFVGFSNDLVMGVYVGFDQPRSLGRNETGGVIAAPIFKAFMAEALANTPAEPFAMPSGLRLVKINPVTGLPPTGVADEKVLWESFIPGTEPGAENNPVLDGLGGTASTRNPGGQTVLPGMESVY